MYQSFSPGNSFNGSAYTSSLVLNSLTLYDMNQPFRVYQKENLIFSFGDGSIIVGGDFTVTGTLTTNNTVINTYSSGLMHLADGNPADSIDIGFYGEYNDGSPVYTGLVRDSSSGRKTWTLFGGYITEPTTVINGGQPIGDMNLDNLKARSYVALGGTSAEPALGFTSSLDTGIYYSGSAIGISLAGLPKLLVSSSSIQSSNLLTLVNVADSANMSDATAAISTLGGISAAKKINCGSLGTGTLTAGASTMTSVSTSTLSTTSTSTTTLSVLGAATLSSCSSTSLSVSGTTTLVTAAITNGTYSNFSGTTLSAGSLSATTANITNLNGGVTALGNTTVTGALIVSNSGTNTINGTTVVQDISGNTGSFLRVRGTSASTSSSSTDQNASIYAAGGASIAANANIGGNVFIGGNLIVSGSTIAAQGSNKITGVETATSVSLDVNKCAVELTNLGTVTVNLPAFTSTFKGKEYYVVSISGSVNLVPSGTNTINGVNTAISISGVPYSKIYIIGIESGWWTF